MATTTKSLGSDDSDEYEVMNPLKAAEMMKQMKEGREKGLMAATQNKERGKEPKKKVNLDNYIRALFT